MRLFAGIELDAPARAHCVRIQDGLRQASFDAAYEAPEKFHLTLAFLGNVPDARAGEVTGVLDAAATASAAFDLELDRLSAFPNECRPRIVYVGSRRPSAAFRALSRTLRCGYAGLGFSFSDDPVAHVTVARVKGGSPRPLPMFDAGAYVMLVHRIALFESLPGEGTTRYDIRALRPLQPL